MNKNCNNIQRYNIWREKLSFDKWWLKLDFYAHFHIKFKAILNLYWYNIRKINYVLKIIFICIVQFKKSIYQNNNYSITVFFVRVSPTTCLQRIYYKGPKIKKKYSLFNAETNKSPWIYFEAKKSVGWID